MSGVFLAQRVSKSAKKPQECKSELVCWLCRKWPVHQQGYKCVVKTNRSHFTPCTRDQVEANLLKANKIYSKGANSQQPPKRNLMEQQKHDNELRKKFQVTLLFLSCKFNTDSAGNSRPLFIPPTLVGRTGGGNSHCTSASQLERRGTAGPGRAAGWQSGHHPTEEQSRREVAGALRQRKLWVKSHWETFELFLWNKIEKKKERKRRFNTNWSFFAFKIWC